MTFQPQNWSVRQASKSQLSDLFVFLTAAPPRRAVLMVGVALACRMTRRRAARISKELELTASTSDNSPSDLSKFSDLERGVYMDKLGSNGSGTGVVR